MPVLPSGRYVGIMSERARYHAGRQKLRITEKTPHHHLYPLIDILVEQPHNDVVSGSGYGFSGYTLADINWIGLWPEADRTVFLNWIREPAQVQLIEQARRRLLAEKTLPKERTYVYPQRLYSLLRHRLESFPQQRAPARQWQRTLLNLRGKGIRREELNWSGVMDFLSQQSPDVVIDKSALMAAIDFSPIQPRLCNELECERSCRLLLQETARKMAAYQLQLAGLPVGDRDVGVVRYHNSGANYRIGVIWPDGHALEATDRPSWFVLGPYSQAIALPEGKQQILFETKQEAVQAAELHALRNHRLRCNLAYRSQYEYMSLHGGEDYREWLVTLPDYHHSHFNGHFFERNILLHIRTKVRRADSGERVLFIEELQSDWQQASLRYGSRGGVPRPPFRKEWVSLALKLMLMHVVEKGLDGIAWAGADVHEQRYDRVLTPLRRLYDEELPRILNRLVRPWQTQVGTGHFATRQPWLHASRRKESWKVEGGSGKFSTRARYNKEQALALIERHSKALILEQPMLLLPEGMRRHIAEHGLPLFGERVDY
ncbi:MAG: hypothetical protein R6X15_09805 [Pseudomonadota bacterium]